MESMAVVAEKDMNVPLQGVFLMWPGP
jgi:hypothetical protein